MTILPLYDYDFSYGGAYDAPTEQDFLSWQNADSEDAEESQDEYSESEYFGAEPIFDDFEDEDEEEIPF